MGKTAKWVGMRVKGGYDSKTGGYDSQMGGFDCRMGWYGCKMVGMMGG